jgi:hypothetical protein
VTGEVVLEGDGTGLSASSFGLTVYPADPDSSPGAAGERGATVRDDWSFGIADVVGTVRFGASRVPDGWWLKSVMVGGINGVDDPVSVGRGGAAGTVRAMFASGAAALRGTVTTDGRQTASEFAVAVYSTEPAKWFPRSPYVQLAAAGQEGTFTVTGLPPGEYYVVAVDGFTGSSTYGDWQNPDLLQSLAPAARRVSLRPGQQATADLRLTVVR